MDIHHCKNNKLTKSQDAKQVLGILAFSINNDQKHVYNHLVILLGVIE